MSKLCQGGVAKAHGALTPYNHDSSVRELKNDLSHALLCSSGKFNLSSANLSTTITALVPEKYFPNNYSKENEA